MNIVGRLVIMAFIIFLLMGSGNGSRTMSLLNSVRIISVINSFTQRADIVIDWVNRFNSIPYQIEIEV